MVDSIFENELLSCELDDSLPVLKHRWRAEPPSAEFRSNLMKVLREYNALKSSYEYLAWLADTTFLGELDDENERWLVEVWEDELFVNAGLKIHAVILGSNIFADYSMERFKKDAEEKYKVHGVELGVFSDIYSAYEWIKDRQLHLNPR